MKKPDAKDTYSPSFLREHWRETLALALWAVALFGLARKYDLRCGLMDPEYSQGVYCGVSLPELPFKVNHPTLQIGTYQEHKLPNGKVLVRSGQPFASLQNCPSEWGDFDDDETEEWMMTACSVFELVQFP